MKYIKGQFVVVPNLHIIKSQKPNLQSVYLWLCSHADENGQCFPSRQLLSDESCVYIKTLDTCLKELINLGILVKETRKKEDGSYTSSIYQIVLKDGGGRVEKGARGGVQTQPRGRLQNGNITIPNVTKQDTVTKKVTETPVTFVKLDSEFSDDLDVFSHQSFLLKLRNSSKTVDQIIALIWKRKGYNFKNLKQAQRQYGMDLKYCSQLTGYTGKEIDSVIAVCERESKEKGYTWSSATVCKKIANVINV
jgi:hypothetical protein